MSRVAVVTGGHSGIGRATALLLEKQGVRVAVFDLDGEPSVDVSDPAGVEAAVAGVRQTLGSVNIVVNAAGIAAGGLPTDDHYIETWQHALAVNLTGAMLVVRACLPDLMAGGDGRIVNVASTEAFGAGRFSSPYTTTPPLSTERSFRSTAG